MVTVEFDELLYACYAWRKCMKRSASTDTHPFTFLQLLEQTHGDWNEIVAVVVYNVAIDGVEAMAVDQQGAEKLIDFVSN